MPQQGQVVYDGNGNPIPQMGMSHKPTGFSMKPSDFAAGYTNINPYTGQAMNNLFQGAGNQYMQSALSGNYKYNPRSGFNTFMQEQANPLANMVSGQMSPLQRSLAQRATQLSNQGMDNVAQRFSQNNALYSSAFGKAASEAGNRPFADVANQLGMQQLNMTNSLWNNQLNNAQQNNNYQAQMNQQAAQLGAQILGMQNQAGEGVYVAPNVNTLASGNEQLQQQVSGFLGNAGQFAQAVVPFI